MTTLDLEGIHMRESVHAAPQSGGLFGSDSTMYLLLGVVLVVMIIFMFRNSRKRRRDQEELSTKMVPGAEIMTSTGIFGTLVSIDEEHNQAVIEISPGVELRVHRQTLSKVVDPAEYAPAEEKDSGEAVTAGEPEFGERSEGDETTK